MRSCIICFQNIATMSIQKKKFQLKRIQESYFIIGCYNGDRHTYNFDKKIQEANKRRKQNLVSNQIVQRQFRIHQERFPSWFQVEDGSGEFCASNLLNTTSVRVPSKCYRLPVAFEQLSDLCSIAKKLIERAVSIDKMDVSLSFDSSTLFCPQKMVLLKHEQSGSVFPEAIKHQVRELSPFTIRDVVGGIFNDDEKAIFITKDKVSHSRYLHSSFARYQFHSSIPTFNKEVRTCYGVLPETVDGVTLIVGDLKIVIHYSLREEWTISADSVVGAVESIIQFG